MATNNLIFNFVFRQTANFKFFNSHGSSLNKLGSRFYGTKTEVEKLKVDGINLHWKKFGSGPHVVLLCPALIGSVARYQPVIQKMNLDEFTYIVWDPPGYGLSRPPDRNLFTGKYPLHTDACLAEKLMEKLGYGRYSVVGWSDGGTTGALMASDFPNKIRKLVVCNSAVRHDKRFGYFIEATSDLDNWHKESKRSLLEDYEKPYIDVMLKNYAKFNEKNGPSFNNWLVQKRAGIKVPTLYIQSSKDALKYQNGPDEYKAQIPHCQIRTVNFGGHDIIEFVDHFVKHTEEFLLTE